MTPRGGSEGSGCRFYGMGGRFIKVMVAETAMAMAVAVAVRSVGAATAMIGIASDAAVPVVGSPHAKNWPGIIHVSENPPGLRPQNTLHGWQPPVAARPRSVPPRPLRPRTKESRFGDLEHRRQALVGNQPGSLFYNRSGS